MMLVLATMLAIAARVRREKCAQVDRPLQARRAVKPRFAQSNVDVKVKSQMIVPANQVW